MLATIAIVGRPNVGKSTLFNRLTRTRNALVGEIPGLTRDRNYGKITINDQETLVIDTGGIGKATTQIAALMAKQTELALQEAQLIIFVVDARAGVTVVDEELAVKLRKLNKTILVAINKTESLDTATIISDFSSLGLANCFAIAAEHNLGISELLQAIAIHLPPATTTLL
jgi:GTP-binding protein